MSNVLLLNGSPHAHGAIDLALTEVAQTLQECGLTTEIVHVGQQDIRGCIACGRCGVLHRCVFDDAVKRLRKENIEVIVHTILGLPGENTADILETMEYLNHMDIQGIKLQLLHVLRGTDLAADYEKGLFQTYERDEYISLLINCLEHLRPDMVIHRITGDGPKDLLIAPLWASRKREVLNMLHHRMKEEQSYQGRLFSH